MWNEPNFTQTQHRHWRAVIIQRQAIGKYGRSGFINDTKTIAKVAALDSYY